MASPTETYVDPSIAAASGSGTIGDPYGDLQHALDTITRDSTNGDRINVKSGTAEVNSSALSLTTYGTPTSAAPLIIQGYTSAAGDGGIGEISTWYFSSTTLDFIWTVDMKLTMSNQVRLDRSNVFVNVLFDGSSVRMANGTAFLNCVFEDISLVQTVAAIMCGCVYYRTSGSSLNGNFVQDTGTGGVYINNLLASFDSGYTGNMFDMTNASTIQGNTIFATAGTGAGIDNDNTNQSGRYLGNLIAGFSGVGGVGINHSGSPEVALSNYGYNNTTDSTYVDDYPGVEAVTNVASDPFTDAANGDFTLVNGSEPKGVGFPASFQQAGSAPYASSMPQFGIDAGTIQIDDVFSGGVTPRLIRVDGGM